MKLAAQLLTTFLLNTSWQVTLIIAFAALCDLLLRGHAARYQHAVWVVTLVSCLLVPVLSTARLAGAILQPTEMRATLTVTPIVTSRIISPDVDEIESPAPGQPASSKNAEAVRSFFSPIHINRNIALALLPLYLLFLLWRGANLFRAWRRTCALAKGTCEFTFPDRVQTIIRKCQTAIHNRNVRMLCSTDVAVPITVGLINPLIVLPESLLHETNEELLTSAIGHELVHIARRDCLLNLIYEFIYIPLSFHPAAALARRRVKQTRELCCDELVATKLLRPDVYARSLVRLIGSAPLPRRFAPDTTIGINESDILEVRIMSLLKTRKLNTRRRTLLLIAAILLLVAPCVAAAKLALSFDFDRQEPGTTSLPVQRKDEQKKQERMREDLKRQAVELKEQLRVAPESRRAEVEARLREVQRALEEQERTLRQSEQLRGERKIEELKEALAKIENNAPADDARIKEARVQIAAMEKLNAVERSRREQEILAQTDVAKAQSDEMKEAIAQTQTIDGNRKAKLIYKVEPEYPEAARAKNIEGAVQLGLTIDHDGVPQNIQIKRSLDPSLDQAAIEAVRQWRFTPAIKDGQPVSMWITVEVYFGSGPSQQEQKEREAREKRELEERAKAEERELKERGQGEDKELREKREFEMKMRREREGQEREEKMRGAGLAAAKWAKISMTQAIQIATSKYPGTVLQSRLFGEREDKVFYQVMIANVEGEKNTVKYVWVSAIDGTILKTEDETRPPIEGGMLNGKALSLPNPTYPAIARAAHADGPVEVRITVDEEGNVVAAKAVSGHPLLQAAAVSAAREAKFAPTRLNGEPVRVMGLITYNFMAQ